MKITSPSLRETYLGGIVPVTYPHPTPPKTVLAITSSHTKTIYEVTFLRRLYWLRVWSAMRKMAKPLSPSEIPQTRLTMTKSLHSGVMD